VFLGVSLTKARQNSLDNNIFAWVFLVSWSAASFPAKLCDMQYFFSGKMLYAGFGFTDGGVHEVLLWRLSCVLQALLREEENLFL